MPPSTDSETRRSGRCLLIAMLAAAGFGLTLFVFYPGVMTFDARYVYEDIAKGTLGDWQSPVMTVLWALIDPIAPGPASLLLLSAAMYWLAFGLLAFIIARRSVWLAVLLVLLALSPPAFVFQGIIWRDVLFANLWLLAAVLAFVAAGHAPRRRLPAQIAALVLLALGVLLRPNALIAAPILFVAIAWPAQFSWRRAAIAFVPVGVASFALVQFIYYGALGATRQHPLQSIMIFDLGGVSHFARQNQFPVTWSASENAILIGTCYQPTQWDIYWRLDPCQFVMNRIERQEKLFGTPAITEAWLRAIAHHPVAYLEHRSAFMWNFLARDNLTMWIADVYTPDKNVFPDRLTFNALVAIHDALKPTPLFRAGTWLVVCLVVCGFSRRRRDTPAGVFAIGACGSAAIYVLTYFPAGVASDFRYGYWAVLAGIAGGIAIIRAPAAQA